MVRSGWSMNETGSVELALDELGSGAHVVALASGRGELSIAFEGIAAALGDQRRLLVMVDEGQSAGGMGWRDHGASTHPWTDSARTPAGLSALIRREADRAQSAGQDTLWAFLDLSWVADAGTKIRREITAALTRCANASACTVFSAYDRNRLSLEAQLDALGAHPYAMVGGRLGENIYCTSPHTQEDAAELVEERLERLRHHWGTAADLRRHTFVLDHISDAVIVTGLDLRIQDWNRGAERIYGWPASQVIGQGLRGLLETEMDESTGHAMSDLINDGVWRGHVSQKRMDGSRVRISASVVSVRDEAGAPSALVAVNREMTPQLESAERLARVLATISDGFISMDRNLVVTDFNPASEALLGRPKAEVLGRPLFEAFPEARGSVFEARYREANETRQALSFETYFGVPPYTNWYDVRVYPTPDGLSVFFQVTTERKEAQEELAWAAARNKAELELSRALLSLSTLEEVSSLVLEHSLRLTESTLGFVGYIDRATGALHCPTMTMDVWPTSEISQKSYVFNEFGGLWGWALDNRQSILCNDPRSDPRAAGVPDGHVPIQRFVAAPAFVGDQLLGIVALANADRDYHRRDLEVVERLAGTYGLAVHRARVEQERRLLDDRIRETQRLESLGLLAGGIAHDFNNLLVGILGNAGLALLDLAPTSPAREMVADIETAAQRASELSRQLLAYSGKGRFVVESFDLSELVREMVHLLRASVPRSAVIKLDRQLGAPVVNADVAQIRQVVMNLITNAADAVGSKGGVITITTGATFCDRAYLERTLLAQDLEEGDYAFLEVSDNGSGMDAATRGRIFDPFFTTKTRGRGLGLAAVMGIVRGHKGALRVYSEVGRGTTFKMLLPRTDDTDRRMGDGSREIRELSGRGLVLVVDDEAWVRDVAKRSLERFGFEVLVANDGHVAVEIFRERGEEIAAVLLDMMMPTMSGVETFRELRRIRSDVRVILSSGYNEQDAITQFTGRGLAGFIQKPYRPTDLVAKIRRAIMP